MKTSEAYRGILFLALSVTLAGCSVSYSTGKSSDTVSTLLDSVSGSSTSMSGGDDVSSIIKTYGEDIEAVTFLYVTGKTSDEEFVQLISSVARTYGIVDWERETMTFEAMGRGLCQAGIVKERIAEFPFFRELTGKADYAFVLQGYNQV